MSEEDNLPNWRGQGGTYEVWFLTFTDPLSGQGHWIRSTLLAPEKGTATAGVWFAHFDPADADASFGIHHRFGPGDFSVPTDRFEVRIGHTMMSSGHASGEVEGGGHDAAWDLRFDTGEPTYRMLPDPFYRGRLAATKPFSPNVATRVSGSLRIDGRPIDIVDVPAQQGHLFGSRHAERWAWAHCADFIDEETVVQALSAQQRRGPFTTPFLTCLGIRWRGKWIRFSKVSRYRQFGLGTWRVSLESRRYRLTGRIEAPARAMIRARYEDPDGRPRYAHNSEIASSRLALFERRAGGFEEVALLESRGTTHAEWSGRTPAPQVDREFAEVAG